MFARGEIATVAVIIASRCVVWFESLRIFFFLLPVSVRVFHVWATCVCVCGDEFATLEIPEIPGLLRLNDATLPFVPTV